MTPIECLMFLKPPSDFSPKVEVAACYCEFEDRILVLRRHPNKSQGGTWGVPAGKLESGEDAMTAIIREVQEEIGTVISKNQIEEIGKVYIRQPQLDFIYYMFRTQFSLIPTMILALEEHTEAKWVTFEEALQLTLMAGEKDTLLYYSQLIKEKNG